MRAQISGTLIWFPLCPLLSPAYLLFRAITVYLHLRCERTQADRIPFFPSLQSQCHATLCTMQYLEDCEQFNEWKLWKLQKPAVEKGSVYTVKHFRLETGKSWLKKQAEITPEQVLVLRLIGTAANNRSTYFVMCVIFLCEKKKIVNFQKHENLCFLSNYF